MSELGDRAGRLREIESVPVLAVGVVDRAEQLDGLVGSQPVQRDAVGRANCAVPVDKAGDPGGVDVEAAGGEPRAPRKIAATRAALRRPSPPLTSTVTVDPEPQASIGQQVTR